MSTSGVIRTFRKHADLSMFTYRLLNARLVYNSFQIYLPNALGANTRSFLPVGVLGQPINQQFCLSEQLRSKPENSRGFVVANQAMIHCLII